MPTGEQGKKEERESEVSAIGGLMSLPETSSDNETSMTNYKIKKPVLTVYMPVFNASSYVSAAIESILSQSYPNFEFIIIDDYSTDRTYRILKSYARQDSRIRLYKNKINLGVSATSNIAISLSRGKFLARMDADDIALPDRFAKQIQFLKANPQVVAVGGQCICIDDANKIIGYKRFSTQSNQLSKMIFWAIPLQQPTIMVNLGLLPKNFPWYDRNKSSAEEVNLMFRFLQYGRLANLPDYLLYYRQLPTSLSRRNPKETFLLTLQSRILALENGYRPSLTAILLNLAQILVISVLPAATINRLWNFVRGISAQDNQYQLGTLAPVKV